MSIDMNNLPLHVAITMDGNGRWATLRNHPRTFGYEEGLRTVKKIVKAASDLGINYMTLYAFSTENWKRAESEVGFLMNLIHNHIIKELNFYTENGIKINHIGDLEKWPVMIQKDIKEAMDKTKDFTGMTVNLAINYGGRDELVRGIKKIVDNKVASEQIDEKLITKYLDMPESPDVDLLIRSGGEKRLSNFLLWHIPYAEQIYIDTLWPDYTKEEFYNNIEEYQKRNRRFGAEKSAK
jgi:undecaprenyl diphosphate synthase